MDCPACKTLTLVHRKLRRKKKGADMSSEKVYHIKDKWMMPTPVEKVTALGFNGSLPKGNLPTYPSESFLRVHTNPWPFPTCSWPISWGRLACSILSMCVRRFHRGWRDQWFCVSFTDDSRYPAFLPLGPALPLQTAKPNNLYCAHWWIGRCLFFGFSGRICMYASFFLEHTFGANFFSWNPSRFLHP